MSAAVCVLSKTSFPFWLCRHHKQMTQEWQWNCLSEMLFYKKSKTIGFISIIASSFFTNLNPTAGEGCLTLADFGDKLTPRGLPVFGLGDMNKTSAKLKYHLEVYSYKCPQKKQNTFCIFCSCSLLQTVSLNR